MKATPLDVARKHRVRKFLLSWRRDPPSVDPSLDEAAKEDVAEVLTGAESVTLQLVEACTAYFRGRPGRNLELLWGVREVSKVEFMGATRGVEEYLEWLRGVMMSPVGSEVGQFQGPPLDPASDTICYRAF